MERLHFENKGGNQPVQMLDVPFRKGDAFPCFRKGGFIFIMCKAWVVETFLQSAPVFVGAAIAHIRWLKQFGAMSLLKVRSYIVTVFAGPTEMVLFASIT